MTMRPLTFFIQPIEKLTFAMPWISNANRLKEPNTNHWSNGAGWKRHSEKESLMRFINSISNPNAWRPIFSNWKMRSQQVRVEVPCGCQGQSAKCSTPTHLPWQYSNTHQAYQELGDHYNDRSWYWTISRIKDLVAKYPDLFEDGAIVLKMERLESQWMVTNKIWVIRNKSLLLLSLKKE